MKTIAVVSILALLAVPLPAEEDKVRNDLPTTIPEFVAVLEAGDDPVPYVWVVGFILGMDAGLYVGHECYTGVPSDTDPTEVVKIFLQFMNAHKDKWEMENAVHMLTAAALFSAYPCPVPEPKASPLAQETDRRL